MNTYIIRALKYMVYLTVLLFVILFVMRSVGANTVSLSVMFLSMRSLILLGVLVVFSLLYPSFGFVAKTLTFNATKEVGEVERVMGLCGYVRIQSADDAMSFRAQNNIKKMMLMWEDTITIETVDGLSTVKGPRKEVVKACFRMSTFIG